MENAAEEPEDDEPALEEEEQPEGDDDDDDFGEEEASDGAGGDEAMPKRPSFKSVTLIDRLQLLETHGKPANALQALDGRRQRIRADMKEKFKEAPKTILQKAEAKKSSIEAQLERSEQRLGELLNFGDELVTNIQVANEKRELQRREHETARRTALERDLHGESVEAMARFDDITARWSELETYKEPVALYEELEAQKVRIAALMASKDEIAAQCQREIDRFNMQYYSDQEQQASDVCCLVERIDAQVELIKAAYRSHMEMLQQTIEDERQSIQLEAANKWRDFYDTMAENELYKFEVVKEKEHFYTAEIARISANQEEITRGTRIRLEKEAELLEWELRNVKNNVLMNSEKLDYNYQVLQKRNEENVVVNNQQKRRVARLNEAIQALRRKLTMARSKTQLGKRKISSDIQKLHASISDLEKKAVQFRRINRRKFDKVWAINYKEMRASLAKLYEIDRILHEQQLIMPWTPPDIDLTDINASDEPALTAEPSLAGQRRATGKKPPKASAAVDVRLLRNIMRKIADRAGFLVEERLLRILAPFTDEEKRVVRIDNIFDALRIRDIATVSSLVRYFEPYAWCPNCSTGVNEEALRHLYTIGDDLEEAHADCVKRTTLNDDEVQRLQREQQAQRKQREKRRADCQDHYLVIEPALVLTSLNEFTRHHWSSQNGDADGNAGGSEQGNTQPRLKQVNDISMDNETIIQFWRKFEHCMPDEKRKLWETLEHGLNHYLEVLKQRSQLDSECTFLRRQNQELKHLLQKFQI